MSELSSFLHSLVCKIHFKSLETNPFEHLSFNPYQDNSDRTRREGKPHKNLVSTFCFQLSFSQLSALEKKLVFPRDVCLPMLQSDWESEFTNSGMYNKLFEVNEH